MKLLLVLGNGGTACRWFIIDLLSAWYTLASLKEGEKDACPDKVSLEHSLQMSSMCQPSHSEVKVV